MRKIQLVKKEKTVKDYGVNLYYIKVPEQISKDREILVYADYVSVENDGSIGFYKSDSEMDEITFALSPGKWVYFYQVHEIGIYPISIHRWKGVAEIRTVEKEPEVTKEIELPPVQEMTDEERKIMEELEAEANNHIDGEEKKE